MEEGSERDIRRLHRLSHWLDELISLPGEVRIGLDGLIGLIPGIGDTLGAAAASYIVAQAARQRVPTPVLVLMIANIAVETLFGIIPVVGDLFDFVWKANLRNVALIEAHRGKASRGRRGNRRLAWLLIILITALLILGLLLAATFIGWVAGLVRNG